MTEGVVTQSAWFTAKGYSSQKLYKYRKNGWLAKVSEGTYVRPGSILEWQGAVLYGENPFIEFIEEGKESVTLKSRSKDDDYIIVTVMGFFKEIISLC